MHRHLISPDHVTTFLSVKRNAEQWLIDSLADCRTVHGDMRARERVRVRAAVKALRAAKTRYHEAWLLFTREHASAAEFV